MAKGYSRFRVKTDWLHYHFVWYTWHNKEVLTEAIAQNCENLLKKMLEEMKCEIRLFSIDSNRVHIAIKAKPYLSPNKIVLRLKAVTSKALRYEHISLKKIPSLWTRSYFVSTYGRIPNRAIKAYEKYIKRKLTS